MSLIYGLVANNATILAEHTASSGNFTAVTQTILEKIPPNNSKLTYVYDRYLFHYISQDGLVYLCMADDTFGRRIPFAFLESLEQTFLTTYGLERAQNSTNAYALNEFSKTIASKMEQFSSNASGDRLRAVQGEIEQVKDIMSLNIERVLERGERIELLVDKTDSLNQQAFMFKKRSTVLRRKMWWKNTKLMVILGVAIVLLLYILVSFMCGFPSWKKCV